VSKDDALPPSYPMRDNTFTLFGRKRWMEDCALSYDTSYLSYLLKIVYVILPFRNKKYNRERIIERRESMRQQHE